MRERGFTIPELLVAMLLFSLVAGAAANVLVAAISSQRNVLAREQIMGESSFVSEYLTRSLRQSKKELSCGESPSPSTCCLQSGDGTSFELTNHGGDQGLRFLDADNVCREVFVAEGALQEETSDNGTAIMKKTVPLTSLSVTVPEFKIEVIGVSQEDTVQPRATIAFVLEGRGTRPEARPSIRMQITVSKRNLDVQE